MSIVTHTRKRRKNNMLTPEDIERYKGHIASKERAREEKEHDKERAKVNQSVYAATFDLEAVLYTPCSNVSQIFYKRKLACYNLSIYDLGSKDGTCYLWDESQAARGSSEIGTCIVTQLQGLPRCVKHVILYSDCCTGQNRNQYITAGLLHALQNSGNLETIEQKFLESGHTQMECDSMHSTIEQAKKRASIFIPSQWDTIITMARKKHPYIVVPLRFNQFYDLQKVAKENYGSFKQTTDGERVNWGKIKIIKIDKKEEHTIMFKYSYDDDNYKKINVEKNLKRGERRSGQEVCLSQKYIDKRPISVEKKKDLISFCNSLVIPPIYWHFYNSLTTNTTVKDRLPLSDHLEDDQDSE